MKAFKIILFLLFVCCTTIHAQTPPAKTWYFNKQGVKTTVKERWSENAEGEKHGMYILYNENGIKYMSGNYLNGKKNGVWKENYSAHYVQKFDKGVKETTYRLGKMHGKFQRISDTYGVIEEGNYVEDERNGYWKEDAIIVDGALVYQQGTYVNDSRQGKWMNIGLSEQVQLEKPLNEYSLAQLWYNNKLITIKGHYAIYKNGELIECFTDKGVDAIEAENKRAKSFADNKKEEAEAEKREKEDMAILMVKLKTDKATIEDVAKAQTTNRTVWGNLEWISGLDQFLVSKGSTDDKFEIQPREYEKGALLNFIKSNSSINFIPFFSNKIDKVILYKTNGKLSSAILRYSDVGTVYANIASPNTVIYKSNGSPKKGIYISSNDSFEDKSDLVTKFYENTFFELSEDDKYKSTLLYSSQFIDVCFTEKALNIYLYRIKSLSLENQQQAAAFMQNIIFNKANVCANQDLYKGASYVEESLVLTYIAYIYWAVGMQKEAKDIFFKVHDKHKNIGEFKRYEKIGDEWTRCTYNDYLMKFFHKNVIKGANITGEGKVDVGLRDEKELLKYLRGIYFS